jgi:membrane associated rhomboid family serine protease
MKTLKHSTYIKAWLAYTLGATLLGGIIGAFIGVILGAILTAAGLPVSQIKLVTAIVGLAFGIPFSYFMFRLAVNKFLLSKIEEESPPAV